MGSYLDGCTPLTNIVSYGLIDPQSKGGVPGELDGAGPMLNQATPVQTRIASQSF